jgi:MFS family permease
MVRRKSHSEGGAGNVLKGEVDEEKMRAINFYALSLDSTFFNIGSAFLDPGTVVPSFVSLLTSSPVLIGLTTTIRNCGWFLPQLLVAHRVEALPHKKPVVVWAGGLLRLAAGMMAFSTLLAANNPILALTLFYLSFVVLSFCDGISGVPWIDIFAKSIPAERRGRYYAVTQFFGGSFAFAAGFLIKKLLDSKNLVFPYNYFVIFFLGFLLVLMSYLSFLRVRENTSETSPHREDLWNFLKNVPAVFKADGALKRLVFVNVLFRCFFLPLPFYVIFAREKLGLAADSVGFFVSAQMLGYVLSGVILGRINDTLGSKPVILITGFATMISPLLALTSYRLYLNGYPFIFLYTVIFAFVGLTYSGSWIGIFNFLLKMAPEEKRPLYIGLLNTTTAPMTFLPVVGGFIIQRLNYTLLFLITFILVLNGLLLAATLKEPGTGKKIE